MTEPIDLVFSGSGTLVPAHVGAYEALIDAGFEVKRVAGTSGGAIMAAGIAAGWDVRAMMDLANELLRDNKLLDPQVTWWKPWGFFRGYGIHAFDEAYKLMARHLPGKMESGKIEWGVFVLDLETRGPTFVSSRLHGHVPIADAVLASASIPVFARMRPIPGLPGKAYVDGGAATNFGMGVWDDEPNRRTIGVRFKGSSNKQRTRVRSVFDFGNALAASLIANANNTYVSKKRYANVIEIRSDGSGLDFDLSPEDIRKRFREGKAAAQLWLDTNYEALVGSNGGY